MIRRFFATVLLLTAVHLAAAGFEVPALTGRVVDTADAFGAEGKARIDRAIRTFEKATGGQMVVVSLKPLENTTIEEAGIALADQWKIGHKGKDDGAILIIIPESRRMRLEIGYGWEGVVNDAKAGDILRGLKGFFREKRYADGAVYAVGKMQEHITGKALPEKERMNPPSEEEELTWEDIFYILIFLVLAASGFWVLSWIFGFLFGGGGGGGSDSSNTDSDSDSSGDDYSGGGGDSGGGGASDDW